MFGSLKHSQLALRIGLAIVFLWFGIDKFIQPQYWIDAWVPQWAITSIGKLGIGPKDFISLLGIFEISVASGLATGFFLRYFAIAGALFLITVFAVHGLNEILVRDLGLIGGLVALILWPDRKYV
jgi:uncharacterized membrane protein YphA (DoxX/SURF4 family)